MACAALACAQLHDRHVALALEGQGVHGLRIRSHRFALDEQNAAFLGAARNVDGRGPVETTANHERIALARRGFERRHALDFGGSVIRGARYHCVRGGRDRCQRLAGDVDRERVVAAFAAPRRGAHQVDTHHVVAIRRQHAGVVRARVADEHRAARRTGWHHVEIVLCV